MTDNNRFLLLAALARISFRDAVYVARSADPSQTFMYPTGFCVVVPEGVTPTEHELNDDEREHATQLGILIDRRYYFDNAVVVNAKGEPTHYNHLSVYTGDGYDLSADPPTIPLWSAKALFGDTVKASDREMPEAMRETSLAMGEAFENDSDESDPPVPVTTDTMMSEVECITFNSKGRAGFLIGEGMATKLTLADKLVLFGNVGVAGTLAPIDEGLGEFTSMVTGGSFVATHTVTYENVATMVRSAGVGVQVNVYGKLVVLIEGPDYREDERKLSFLPTDVINEAGGITPLRTIPAREVIAEREAAQANARG